MSGEESELAVAPEVARAFLPRLSRYLLDVPTAKQMAMLAYPGFEALFGGALGGGKTVVLMMMALQYADIPGYKALLLRRTYQQCKMADGLMTRLVNHLKRMGLDDCWYETKRQALLPEGSVIEIGYAEEERDIHNFDGNEYQFIGIDQVEQFSSYQYKHLSTRLRRPRCPEHKNLFTQDCKDCQRVGPIISVPLRMRSSANPTGPFKNFYKHWFIKSKPPRDDRGIPQRIFIPARAVDNPHIDIDSYERQFQIVDKLTHRRLWEGDWDAESEGMMFSRHWFRLVKNPPPVICKIRAWDRAGSTAADADWTVGALMGLTADGQLVMLDEIRGRWTTNEVDEIQRATAAMDGIETTIWGQQDPGAAGKGEDERIKKVVLPAYNYSSEPVQTSLRGAKSLRARPLAVFAESGRVLAVESDWIESTLDELEQFDPEGKHEYDDRVDAWGLACRKLTDPVSEDITSWAGDQFDEEVMERILHG